MLGLFAAGLFTAAIPRAQVIASDSFAYPVGSLAGNNGGTGWSGAWLRVTGDAASTDQQVNATGLTLANLVTSGGRIVQPANDHRNYRAIDTSRPAFQPYIDTAAANAGTIRATYGPAFGKPGTTIWFGFLIKTTAAYFSSYGGMHLMDGMDLSMAYGDKALHQRFQFGKDHNTHWGMARTTNGYTGISSQDFASTVLADANQHLLVYRIDFHASDQTEAWMWIDPAVGSTPATAGATLHATGIYDFHFNAVNVGADGVFDFDELRIGLAYADVVPSTTPTYTLSVARLGSGGGSLDSGDALIQCGAMCSHAYPASSMVTLNASPDAVSVFTGWLGACTGTAACQVTLDAAKSVSGTFAPSGTVATLDVDASAPLTQYDALTDGLLMLRYLAGVTGPTLVGGVVNPAGTRTDATAIAHWLDDVKPLFDIDGDGRADPLTDGLLVLRWLFGLRGPALTAGATAPGATRSQNEIETALQSLVP